MVMAQHKDTAVMAQCKDTECPYAEPSLLLTQYILRGNTYIICTLKNDWFENKSEKYSNL